ncbi:MAG: helix-turn-helix domain-containing protein [Pseudomonadota bacterium]
MANSDVLPIQVAVVAVPQTSGAGVLGVAEYLVGTGRVTGWKRGFSVHVVGPEAGVINGPLGSSVVAHKHLSEVGRCDVVVVPAMLWDSDGYRPGLSPETVTWLMDQYEDGAILCGACTGPLLIAETGLLDGEEATVHWAYIDQVRRYFPKVKLRAEQVFVAGGTDKRLITTGGSGSWHDLVLYLIAKYAGPAAARSASSWFMVDWHQDGQSPYAEFVPSRDHGDALISNAQIWLDRHYRDAQQVNQLAERFAISDRSFKRRFRSATGYSPLQYLQALRVERAKRLLETTAHSVDDISHTVGYENPAFFRRLFKRVVGITPAAYRKRFQVPAYARNALSASTKAPGDL